MKKKNNLMHKIKENTYKVVRLSNTEFELDNGNVYPLPFELESNMTLEKFQEFINNSKEIMLNLLDKIDNDE